MNKDSDLCGLKLKTEDAVEWRSFLNRSHSRLELLEARVAAEAQANMRNGQRRLEVEAEIRHLIERLDHTKDIERPLFREIADIVTELREKYPE